MRHSTCFDFRMACFINFVEECVSGSIEPGDCESLQYPIVISLKLPRFLKMAGFLSLPTPWMRVDAFYQQKSGKWIDDPLHYID